MFSRTLWPCTLDAPEPRCLEKAGGQSRVSAGDSGRVSVDGFIPPILRRRPAKGRNQRLQMNQLQSPNPVSPNTQHVATGQPFQPLRTYSRRTAPWLTQCQGCCRRAPSACAAGCPGCWRGAAGGTPAETAWPGAVGFMEWQSSRCLAQQWSGPSTPCLPSRHTADATPCQYSELPHCKAAPALERCASTHHKEGGMEGTGVAQVGGDQRRPNCAL